MIRPEFRKILLDQRGAAVILWAFFIVGVAVYLIIARIVLANPKYALDLSFAGGVRAALWILAVVDLGYVVWWKRSYLTSDALLAGDKQSKLLKALEDNKGPVEKRAAFVISTYVTRKVVVFALIEALAVYGLILAVVGRYLGDHYLLSALTLILLAGEFPSQKFLGDLLQRIESAD